MIRIFLTTFVVRATRHVSRILKSRVFGFQKKKLCLWKRLTRLYHQRLCFYRKPKIRQERYLYRFSLWKPLLDTFWVFVNNINSVSFQNSASMVESLQLVLSKNTVKMSCTAEYYVKLSFRATFQILELLVNKISGLLFLIFTA